MSRHTAEHLEVLGKNASALYRSGGAANLTEAVLSTVKTAGLLPEQVKRVVEHANTDAFLTEFHKQGAHKVVDLDGGPASPFAVLQGLNQTEPHKAYDRGTSDYDYAPSEKRASAEEADAHVRDLFATDPSRAGDYPLVDPFGEAYALHQKLASTEESLTSDLTTLEGYLSDLTLRLRDSVKEAALEEVPLGDVVRAWSTAPGASVEHVKVAFALVAPYLVERRVFADAGAVGASLEKSAAGHREVDSAHPLVEDFGDFCAVLSKLAAGRAVREEVAAGRQQLGHFLKLAAASPGLIHQVYDATGRAGKVLGSGAERVSQALLGPASPHSATVGRVVHKAVEHLPTAGAVVAVNEARRGLKYNQTYQGAKDTALSVVPGTPQYRQRELELAGGSYQMPMGY